METGLILPSAFGIAGAALAAPLLSGVINRTKAVFAGRRGQPLLQAYHDIIKLLGKGAVYSRTTTWVFRAGPIIQFSCAALALALLPMGFQPALLAFPGDFICLAGLLALMRFSLMAAALDTGSSFEGMGASREAAFSALAEPVFLLSLAVLARLTGALSLSGMASRLALHPAEGSGPVLVLTTLALFVVLLAENARVPVDDPNTHLELTMIHEVMALDHGGPDLAFIQYAAQLKLWIMGILVVNALGLGGRGGWACAGGMAALAVLIGIVESTMARLRLLRVPQLMIGAGALSLLALLLTLVRP